MYKIYNGLNLNERILLKKLEKSLSADFDYYDPAMIINTLQHWVLRGGDFANATTPDEIKQSLYNKLYEPCMAWLVVNHKPEVVEALKWYLEEQHDEIMEAA